MHTKRYCKVTPEEAGTSPVNLMISQNTIYLTGWSLCFNFTFARVKFESVLDTSLLNETQLISLLRIGDQSSFEILYNRYSSRLLGYLLKMTKSEDLAAEILQDTFLKIWKNRGNLDPVQSFRAYLFKVSSNLVYDFFRKAARDKVLREKLIRENVSALKEIEEFLIKKEKIKMLEDVIKELPPRRREIFRLVKLEERSYAEVGSMLQVSPSTINDHIVKATKFIQQKLAPYSLIEVAVLLSVTI